ncbi:MAG: helix-turn-helix transcriptional regulator [Spirochaetaceae bacterium]|nr:MAG: helix-turn-helix transcriptional regulator [Spirochaetaceae bacterium]
MNRAIEAYKAIGEETRLRILRLLRLAPGELCVCEVVDVLRKPQYTVSKSLTVLRKAELVEERREGKFMMYKLLHSPFNDKLFESLDRLPDPDRIYEIDSRRLAERLVLREKGKCVITCR